MIKIDKLSQAFIDYVTCYAQKCKIDVANLKKIRINWQKKLEKPRNDYMKGKITYELLMKKTLKLDNDYYNSVQHLALTQCKLKKCYDKSKKYLDALLRRLNYPIKKKYNLNDFIKILELNKKEYVLPKFKDEFNKYKKNN
jgi:hypothetical protein